MCCGWNSWMGGWGGLGLLGWLIGIVFTLGLIFLFVVGVIWIARQMGRSQSVATPPVSSAEPPATAARTCPTCGRPMAAGWNVCPYDGTPLVQ